ncbi:hypothetical protein NIES4071_01590 [Calothrix sp. NIES-4071]|nr:hypothetical protein NIES4071_01590 [Calothrix sp. NIES-4071]BAZ54505.1 hypothetical protein NIES4105_01580 [Calothrix sp. NIES-4105]
MTILAFPTKSAVRKGASPERSLNKSIYHKMVIYVVSSKTFYQKIDYNHFIASQKENFIGESEY